MTDRSGCLHVLIFLAICGALWLVAVTWPVWCDWLFGLQDAVR